MIGDFRSSIDDAQKLRALYEHCVVQLKLPGDYSDLLRMGFIYCLSAFDKLIHEIIAHRMVEVYLGQRTPTAKYQSESLTVENHTSLLNASVPPAEIVFENIVQLKLSHLTFMDPQKLADGLSLVWSEPHKWQAIAITMGRTESQARTELRNLYKRRNAIVHEADRDPGTADKLPIDASDAERVEVFVRDLGETIYKLV